MKNTIKDKLRRNQVTIGSWITMSDPIAVEIMAQAGFEWLAVDMEHSALTIKDVQNHIRIIESLGLTSLVRVSANDSTLIKRVMDAGASGVIVPMVNSAEEAIQAVNAVKYPPIGTRGVGLARAQGYGFNFNEYKKNVNSKSIVIVQIEHFKAIDNLEEILSAGGVDAFIVGPYDLSASYGVPGNFNNAKMKAALKKIIKIAKEMKVVAGFHVITPDSSLVFNKIKEGYKFIAFSLDTLFLGTACRQAITKIKNR